MLGLGERGGVPDDHCRIKEEEEGDPPSMEKLLLLPIKLLEGDKKGLPLLVGRLGVRGEDELLLLSTFMLSPDSELAILSAADDMAAGLYCENGGDDECCVPVRVGVVVVAQGRRLKRIRTS